MCSLFVVYKLLFPDGTFYIGKTNDLNRRINEHKRCEFNDVNLKDKTVCKNGGFRVEILYSAPTELSKELSELCICNMEKSIIHNECKKIYDEMFNCDSNFLTYSPYKSFINKKIVNSILY